MSNFKPESMAFISPYLMVQDVSTAVDFYQKCFGFDLTDEVIPNEAGEMIHAALAHHGERFMIGREGEWEGKSFSPATSGTASPVGFYVYVADVDKHYQHCKEAGAEIVDEPSETFWGDRMYRARDNNGYVWSFASTTQATIDL